MSESKHTPGPWEFKRPHNESEGIWARIPHLDRAAMIAEVSIRPSLRIDEEGKVWALLAYESYNQFPSDNWCEMQKANAALITAAPETLRQRDELLEALSELMSSMRDPDKDTLEEYERIAEDFYHATGLMAPGKDDCLPSSFEERDLAWKQYFRDIRIKARTAITHAKEERS